MGLPGVEDTSSASDIAIAEEKDEKKHSKESAA
jgi:hypothetical protein